MPFVLRQESDTTNPPLATVYGKQITAGKNVYYIKEGRVKCIIILGEGEMDGVDQVLYNGEIVPEFASAVGYDRNWRFHSGTITTQPSAFFDVVAIAGDTITLATPFGATASNVIETITATGGTRSLSFLGETTADIAYNANAATIQAALEALTSVDSGDIVVSGSGPFTYTFSEAKAIYSPNLTVNTNSLTGTSTFSRPAEVALVAGVDPEPSPYPDGVKQHQKLYVVYSSGNNVKLALSPGGTPLTWTSSQYLLDNLKVYKADGGFFDPIQGRPEFFPNIDFTFSRMAYLEVNLPANMSEMEDGEPTKFKIFVRGRRLQNYDATGALADKNGVAYVGTPPAQTKFFSANNALIAADIILNYMKVTPDRIDWPSWVAYRDHCDALITWNSGSLQVLGNPSLTLINAVSPVIGSIEKSGGVGGTWDAGAITVQHTSNLGSVAVSGVYRGGYGAIGLTSATTGYVTPIHSGSMFSINLGDSDRVIVYQGSTEVYNEIYGHKEGDTFKIEIIDSTVDFYKNDTLFYTMESGLGAGTAYGYVSLLSSDAKFSDIKFFPVTGSNRVINRFDAHLVFPSETDSSAALQQVFGRSPDCHWQDVNGKIKFIVGSKYKDVTWGETALTGDRVLSALLSFDPTSTAYQVPVGTPDVNKARNGTVSVSSTSTSGTFPASSLNNGSRITNGWWSSGEGWMGAQTALSPTASETVVIDLNGSTFINKVSVFTTKDSLNYSSITNTDTFATTGVQDFTVEYWNGKTWSVLDTIINNNKVWVDVTFPIVNTDKIRLVITKAADNKARLVEVEAWGPETIQTIVPRSNIVKDSVSAYKTPPENKPNFLRIEVRDLDDPVLAKKYVYIDRPELRDQADTLIDMGIMQLGVASQSLADRIGESVMRWGSDLDLFISLKGMPSTYALSKGDIVKLAHPVTGWNIDNPVTFVVIEETIESGNDTADEKTYVLQSYTPDVYSDSKHGAISAAFPITTSPLTPPPAPTSMSLTEETRTLPDGTSYTAIVGRVFFDSSYPYSQRVRIYWKKALDVEFVPTSIVMEQPNTGVSSIPFELNFASIGVNEVKAVTETLSGVVSLGSYIQSIDISGTAQVEEVTWEQFVNTQVLGNYLVKVAGVDGWNAACKSNKAIAYGDGYLQFTYDTISKYTVGFNCYNYSDNTDSMKYGLKLENGALPFLVINGSSVAANGNAIACAVGQAFKIDVQAITVSFYQVANGVTNLIGTTPNVNMYPLYADTSIYATGNTIPPVQIYGRLEYTTGIKAHWQSVRSVGISSDSAGIETITKLTNTGWAFPDSAGTFSAERLISNGSIEWEATESTTYRLAGLSELDAEATNPTISGISGIQFGWYEELGGTLTVREYGVQKYYTTYTAGDILRIERINGQIQYRKNGVLHYTSTSTSTAPLYADTAFYSPSSTIKNLRVKRVGAFTSILYSYPIYLVQTLEVHTNRPQDDGTAYFELTGTFVTAGEEPVQRAKVKVYDKFGTMIADLPPYTYTGNGYIGTGFHQRKYADPFEEAIYEVRLDNGNGLSGSVFVKGNGTFPPTFTKYFEMPALLNPVNSVKNLVATAIDHNRISVVWSYTNPSGGSNNIDLQYRQDGQAWAAVPTGSNLAPSSFEVAGLQPSTVYEFRAAPTGTTTNWSNIGRVKTLQAPLPTDVAPPPLSLVGTLNSVNPDTKIDLTWNRNSTTNTGVKIYQNGTLVYTGTTATEVAHTITGLTANTAYTFKVKNVYAGGDSAYSNEISVTTATSDSVLKPSGLSAVARSSERIDISWTNNTTSGNIVIEQSMDNSSWTTIDTVPATTSVYYDIGLLSDTTYYYRVTNDTVSGYSNTAQASTWVFFPPGGCVLPSTLVWAIINGVPTQVRADSIKVGDTLVTVLAGGTVAATKVRQVFPAITDTLNIITTESGKTLECSPSHPLIASMDCEVIRSSSVTRGTKLLTFNPELEIVDLEVVESKETLYGNFNVLTFALEGGDHTFVSGDIVSHNISEK